MLVPDTGLALITPWATAEEAVGDDDCPGCGAGLDTDALTAGIADASAWLHAMSGWRYPGVSGEVVARPCGGRDGQACWHGAPLVLPGDSPHLYPIWGPCGCAGTPCTCCGPEGVTLGRAPVVSVTEVKVDGAVVDVSNWALVGDVLARTDGDRWPCCQYLSLPDTEAGTFSVAFTWGVAPPSLGGRAAVDLGCVLAKAACGDAGCKAAENVVRKTAGGVTVELQSPTDDILKSLPLSVRLFLEAFNPGGYQSGPVLRRPAVLGARRGR